mmetsp:Transcript_33639/g.60173  ORF Transcript_33639/g.60173 Transcript_33639/m.60173 type:complete len:201 (-) Transcript_33639:622-1224(-)
MSAAWPYDSWSRISGAIHRSVPTSITWLVCPSSPRQQSPKSAILRRLRVLSSRLVLFRSRCIRPATSWMYCSPRVIWMAKSRKFIDSGAPLSLSHRVPPSMYSSTIAYLGGRRQEPKSLTMLGCRMTPTTLTSRTNSRSSSAASSTSSPSGPITSHTFTAHFTPGGSVPRKIAPPIPVPICRSKSMRVHLVGSWELVIVT